jgi:hypothetical protein
MGDKLTEGAEVLFRQIHPNFMHDGVPSSDRFMPSERDENRLSVDRSSMVAAAESHALYTSGGLASAAVFGLTVAEFASEAIACFTDPVDATEDRAPNPAHALADYSAHAVQRQRMIAKRLKRAAVARGQLHPASDK